MVQKKYTLGNKLGIHARPAAEIVKLAGSFKSKVTLATQAKKADAKSLLLVMSLGAKNGTEVEITCEGEDEVAALEALDGLFSNNFNEE